MNKKKLIGVGFLSTVGTFLYVMIIGFIMSNGNRLFGKMTGLMAPATFLLLFVFSALITSFMVLGYPIWLYFEGRKKESLFAFSSVVGWIFLFLVMLFSWRVMSR